MAHRNYLIEGSSGAGKTTVATELERRGYHAVHGDRVLAYQGDPETGERLTPPSDDPKLISDHHIWDLDSVRAIIADKTQETTFFCGGSRNWQKFIDEIDAVFLLELDRETLERRIDSRVDEWGSALEERAIILALHETRQYQPDGIRIDATRPLVEVVDAILAHCR